MINIRAKTSLRWLTANRKLKEEEEEEEKMKTF